MSTTNPAVADPSLANDATQQSAAEQKAWGRVDKIFEYFERLGIASAVGVGGMAVIHFRSEVFAAAPFLPGLLGVSLVAGAFFLLVFGTAASVRAIFGNVGGWVLGVITLLSLAVGISFVRAGFYVAAASLNPPAPAVAPAQPVPCAPTTILQGEAAPAKIGTAAASPTK